MSRPLTDFEAIRAQDLLVQRASESLSDSDARELEALGASDVTSFDLAAALVDVAKAPVEDMPEDVASRVLAAALAMARKPAAPFTAPALPAIASSMLVHAVPDPRRARPAPPRRGSRIAIAGALAAAVVAGLVIGRLTTGVPVPPPAPAVASEPARDDVVAAWRGEGVTGSIRWSPVEQRGVLEIRGLVVNDPARARFQVWIVDGTRDPRYPVDGGLFDVHGPAASLTVQPRVHVGAARELFITREAPDGAVVSDRLAVVARAVF